MARGHQKELARQRSDKNNGSGKPTTQKGTAGKKMSILYVIFTFNFSCEFNISMFSL
jgi:hypothetical protein